MATSENVKGRGGLTGRHVLMMLIAFFGVIFAVNGVFLYAAISTFDGTDTSSAYQKGIDYNTTIAESEEQARRADERGDGDEIGRPREMEAGGEGRNERGRHPCRGEDEIGHGTKQP